MTRVFEGRAIYDPNREAVAVVTFTVECHPGQVSSITEFLVEVRDKAGVYSVDFDHDVRMPEEKKEPVAAPIEVPLLQGEASAEPELQQPDAPAEAGAGVGSEAAPLEQAEQAEHVDFRVDSEVAGPAGEIGTGSGERDS